MAGARTGERNNILFINPKEYSFGKRGDKIKLRLRSEKLHAAASDKSEQFAYRHSKCSKTQVTK